VRTLGELLSSDPAWPLVQSWIAGSTRTVDVLQTDRARGEAVLVAVQVTTRSPMGALALETGGILVDGGWLRVLGGGGSSMEGDLARWNGLGDRPIIERSEGLFLVAHDAIGGFFALDGGALGEGKGGVFYFAPDSLEWEDLELGYSEWLSAMLSDRIEGFYADNRWHGWEREVAEAGPDRGISIAPPLWTKESRPIEKASRRPVPLAELWGLQHDIARQLAAAFGQG
jgi:hypothetical protein